MNPKKNGSSGCSMHASISSLLPGIKGARQDDFLLSRSSRLPSLTQHRILGREHFLQGPNFSPPRNSCSVQRNFCRTHSKAICFLLSLHNHEPLSGGMGACEWYQIIFTIDSC